MNIYVLLGYCKYGYTLSVSSTALFRLLLSTFTTFSDCEPFDCFLPTKILFVRPFVKTLGHPVVNVFTDEADKGNEITDY